MNTVAHLPTEAAASAAWDRFAGMIRMMEESPRLRRDDRHVRLTLEAHAVLWSIVDTGSQLKTGSGGIVHVMVAQEGAGFEIGHESASGSSWGFFSYHASLADALVAAYVLNRNMLEGACVLLIHDDALSTNVA